jgi:dienelactone hydrolase
MAEVLLFHHAQGRTPGVEAFAEQLRAGGHTVHVPDLYDGRTFSDLESGIGYADEIGFDTVVERGVAAADGLPAGLVYAGFSLGVMPAQKLTQTRPGALGALLVAACVPPSAFGAPWPAGVPVQVHGKDADPVFAEEGDLEAARDLVANVDSGELFLYAGKEHLFMDNSLPSYDEAATAVLLERTLAFLG